MKKQRRFSLPSWISAKFPRSEPREARVAPHAYGVRRRPFVFLVVSAGIFALTLFFGWIASKSHLAYYWGPAGILLVGTVAAFLTFQASSWIFGFSPAFFALATAALSSQAGLTGFESAWFAAAILVGASHALFAAKPCWAVLRQPRLRWWKSAPRIPLELRARICPVTGGEFTTWSSDLSEKGAFFSLDPKKVALTGISTVAARVQTDPVVEIKAGTHVSLRLELNQYTAFSCSARVVRREEQDKGVYGTGFAVLFVGLNARQKRQLAKFLRTVADERAPATLKIDTTTQTLAA